MADFRAQIEEDIKYYQERHPFLEHIMKPEWAFNFWVLDKLFSEDEDEIENKVIDYADNGIDCYVWHEDSKDLYLIQNKYYSDNTPLSKGYFNTSIQDGYSQLLNGTYSRSPELQKIFSKNAIDPDFYVYHYYYVTNNNKSESVEDAVRAFNEKNSEKKRFAKVFYLDDIEEAFYGEPRTPEKHLKINLETINKGTRLVVNNQSYGLSLPIDAQFIMLPVVTLYRALVCAEEAKYPIFDANIREYLGAGKSVNKRIIETLENKDERCNFFYYNNGITIICTGATSKTIDSRLRITLEDPQIVNGCQTVSSIKHVLSSWPASTVDEEFANTFVMTKILQIPEKTEEMETLRKNIVRFNNSQNKIEDKTFTANDDLFVTLQEQFAKYGFLLLLKQSDKNKFSGEYPKPTKLKEKAQKKMDLFGLSQYLTKTQDFMIPLEKLLQVVLAFAGDAQQAFQKKGYLLKADSLQNRIVTEAIRWNPEFTTQRLLSLYLLYLRAEKTKSSANRDGRTPIPWYLIEGFSKIQCEGGLAERMDSFLSTPDSVNRIINLYTGATKMYLKQYCLNNEGKDYNSMIKEKLDIVLLKDYLDICSAAL